jgi:benzoyl-CoA reductase/2-hydroxyglutaryl-CoA dehydratase subunit BcrC/BadD/HgdB
MPQNQEQESNTAMAARMAALQGSDRKAVGYVGCTVPTELILAAGCEPFLVKAEAVPPGPLADEHVEEKLDPEMRSLFDQIASGRFEFLDLLVVTASSDGYAYLFDYLKALVGEGEGGRVPPLYMLDLIHNDSPEAKAYNLVRMEELIRRLENLAARTVTTADLQSAIRVVNAEREGRRQVLELRDEGLCDGRELHGLIASSFYLPGSEFRARISAVRNKAPSKPTYASRVRFLISSSETLYHDRLHRAVEEAGGLVALEDDRRGSRSAGSDIPVSDAPLKDIALAYSLGQPSPRLPYERWQAWFADALKSGKIDAVLFYVPPSDEYYGWRYPDLRDAATKAGLPTLLVRDDALGGAGFDKIKSQVAQFLAGAKRGAGKA